MIRVRVRGRVRVRVRVGFHTCCVLLVSRLVLNIMLVGERFLLLPLGLGLGLGYHTATVSVAPGQCKGTNPLPFSYRCHPNTPLQVVDLCKGALTLTLTVTLTLIHHCRWWTCARVDRGLLTMNSATPR